MKAQDFGKVAVLMGGNSAEREVSLKSGAAVLAALQRRGVNAHGVDAQDYATVLTQLRSKKFARVFIALHGRGGEDGTLQGALELLGLPYTGSGVLASSLAMDKWRTKMVWQAAGIPVGDYMMLDAHTDPAAVVARLGLPLFVKPSREGSSIGVTKVKRAEDLAAAYHEAAKYDDLVLAERMLEGKEVNFPILGDQVLPSIHIEPATEFYDYQAKYFRDDTRYHCPGLPVADEQRLRDQVLQAFRVLGCSGWGRMDVFVGHAGQDAQVPQGQGGPGAADGQVYFLEMNTVPGMTDHSLVPMGARAAGIEFDELVWRILHMSVKV